MRFTNYDLRFSRVRASQSAEHLKLVSRNTQHATRSGFFIRPSSFVIRAGFSLIELLVAVALMSFIVLGLLTMFHQTQKAFKASMTQTDVLESGRILIDMLSRELGEMTPSSVSTRFTTNYSDLAFTTNFFAELSPVFNQPMLQGLPGTTFGGAPGTQDRRTNVVQKLFFLTHVNQDWIGIGYQVVPDYANAGVGTLYRFAATNRANYGWTNLSARFLSASLPELQRITDGVVHFRVRAFATNGYAILNSPTNAIFRTNSAGYGSRIVKNAFASGPLSALPDDLNYYFRSNAVPAYVDLEVGVIEPHILERFKGIGTQPAPATPPPPAPTIAAQQRYLSNHVAQVHLYRQRVPIRTVDFSAYQ